MSENKAKDYFGQTLNEGDEIVFMVVGYRDFTKGVIKKVNKMKVTIVTTETGREVQQFHDQVIKVPEDLK